MFDMEFTHDDYIIFKLDVEGAEYPILHYIIQHEDCMAMFDEIYIEWHPWGQDDFLSPDHERGPGTYLNLGRKWTETLRAAGVKVEKWL